jgi:hypothetical protein
VAIVAAGAGIRVFTDQFWMLLLGQVAIAVSQPYIMNRPAKLVVDWFDEREGALATGLGTMGMFLGMAASLVVTPALVDGIGLWGAMAVFAAVSMLSALLFALFVHRTRRAITGRWQPPRGWVRYCAGATCRCCSGCRSWVWACSTASRPGWKRCWPRRESRRSRPGWWGARWK